MSAHTPGPWRVEPGERFQRPACIYSADGEHVASVFGGDVEGTGPNARLIAAAPDLLAALEDMLRAHCAHATACMVADETHEVARLAIAKAKGTL